MTKIQTFAKGILVENPLLILSIGLCSSLGITYTVCKTSHNNSTSKRCSIY